MPEASQVYVLELPGRSAAKIYRDRGVFTVDAMGLTCDELTELLDLAEDAQTDHLTIREAA